MPVIPFSARPRRGHHLQRLRTALLAGALGGALLVATATPAQAADHPKIGIAVVLGSVDASFARYQVATNASTEFEHTRAEWVVTHECDGSGKSGTRGTADTATKTRYFVAPTVEILVPLGSLCQVSAIWLVGGGGCSTCDGRGDSQPVTFAAPPGVPRHRYDPAEKQAARRLRDSARRLAAKYTASGCATSSLSCGLVGIYAAIAAYQDRIVNDPPDKRFRQRVRIARPVPRTFGPAEAGTAAGALNALAAAGSDALGAGLALDTAVDRAQGALVAKQRKHERVQMRDAGRFSARLARALDALAARSVAASAALVRAAPSGFAGPLGQPEWTTQRATIIADGLPPALQGELQRLRVPPAFVDGIRGALATTATVPEGPAAAALADPELLAAERGVARMLRGWAKARLRR